MSTNRIGKAIKESCKDDKRMERMLLELLEFNIRSGGGRTWYKEEYRRIVEKYAKEGE